MLGAQHTLVLPYLENLCAHEETVVRERAVGSITKLLDLYTDNDINNYIIPLVKIHLWRSSGWRPMKPILLVEFQLHYSCAMFIQELALTRRRFDSKEPYMQQIFRYIQWGNVTASESDSHQDFAYVQGLRKGVCAQWFDQHSQAQVNWWARPD